MYCTECPDELISFCASSIYPSICQLVGPKKVTDALEQFLINQILCNCFYRKQEYNNNITRYIGLLLRRHLSKVYFVFRYFFCLLKFCRLQVQLGSIGLLDCDDADDDDIGCLILMYHGHGVTNAILVSANEDHSLYVIANNKYYFNQ